MKEFNRLVKIIKSEKLRNEALEKILKTLLGKYNKKCYKNRFSIMIQFAKQKGKAFGVLNKVMQLFKLVNLKRAFQKIVGYSENKKKSITQKNISKTHFYKKRTYIVLKTWRKYTAIMKKTAKFINKNKSHFLKM